MCLEAQTIEELERRVALGSMLIKMLHQDSDPRAKQAIEELQRQQGQINEVLVRKIKEDRVARGEPEPEPVVVGLKPLKLTAKTSMRRE